MTVAMPSHKGVQQHHVLDFNAHCATQKTNPNKQLTRRYLPLLNVTLRHAQVGIPTVAVVENMAGVSLPSLAADADAFAAKHELSSDAADELRALLTKRVSIFGESHVGRLKDMWGIDASFSLPLLQEVLLPLPCLPCPNLLSPRERRTRSCQPLPLPPLQEGMACLALPTFLTLLPCPPSLPL